jgi:hypothetical protein
LQAAAAKRRRAHGRRWERLPAGFARAARASARCARRARRRSSSLW